MKKNEGKSDVAFTVWDCGDCGISSCEDLLC